VSHEPEPNPNLPTGTERTEYTERTKLNLTYRLTNDYKNRTAALINPNRTN
jgi:hypothetical protein